MRIGSVYPIRRLALITGALASNQREHPLPLWGFIAEQTPRVAIRHQKRGASARWFGPELVIVKWAAFPNSNYRRYTFVPFADYLSGSILGMSYSSYSRRSAPSLNRRVSYSGSAVNHSPGHPLVRLSYSGFPFALSS